MRRNAELAAVLEGLGWSVSRLVHEVNREMGRTYVSRTTASEWLNVSRIPRQPLPTVVAHVLSQACDSEITTSQLWPGVPSAPRWVPADHGTRVGWGVQGTKALAHDWFANAESTMDADRRNFMAISGKALTLPAWQYVDNMTKTPKESELASNFVSAGSSKPKIPSSIVEMLRSTVAHLRRMDDIEGGGRQVLGIVHGELRKVAGYLRSGSFEKPRVASDVLAIFGQLAQLAGWVSYDSERHGLAQRYFRTGLQAAHSVGDPNLGAYILGGMACHAAYCGRKNEATEIGYAAVRAARNGHSMSQSLAYVRLAYTEAALGNLAGFRGATDKAREMLSLSLRRDREPRFLYWYDENYLDILSGEALQMLSFSPDKKPSNLLEEAEGLLLDKIDKNSKEMPRDSLFHNLWHARAHVRLGNIQQACLTARRVLQGLQGVDSPRTVSTLRRLDKDLAARRMVSDLVDIKELRRDMQPLIAN